MASSVDNAAPDSDLRSALCRLTIARDGDEYILARSDLGVYVAVPRPGAVLIEALRDGASLAVATRQASDAAGEEVDSADFLTGLGAAGLLPDPRDDLDDAGPTTVPGTHMAWVEHIPRWAVKPLFGRVAWAFYVAAAVAVVTLFLVRPDLRPIFDDVWFLTDPIWSLIAMFVISVLITAGHECWHWLAGRALGVPARFRVSRRGIFVVFETDLSPLVTLPRRARYSPLFAGLAFDVVLLAAALLIRLGFREEILNDPPQFDRFLGAVVFRQVIVVIWQLAGVGFRSDSYVVLANALGCHNLFRATALTFRYRTSGLDAGQAGELAAMSPRDRSVASWFWLVYVAGGFFMFWAFIKYLAPFTYGMIEWVSPNITAFGLDTFVFWQSLALVALLLAQFAVVPLIAWRERRTARAAPPAMPTRAVPRGTRTVRSRQRLAWQAAFTVFLLFVSIQTVNDLKKYFNASDDATADNLLAAEHNAACLPGRQVTILDFPHVSQLAAKSVVYNSNPATSGPHYGAALAPGIYRSPLQPGQTVHALEHGRVVIHYRPDTPPDIVRKLESIGKRFAHDTVVQPNPDIGPQIALTAFGRIDTMDSYDEARIVTFVDQLRGRYAHRWTFDSQECLAGS